MVSKTRCENGPESFVFSHLVNERRADERMGPLPSDHGGRQAPEDETHEGKEGMRTKGRTTKRASSKGRLKIYEE